MIWEQSIPFELRFYWMMLWHTNFMLTIASLFTYCVLPSLATWIIVDYVDRGLYIRDVASRRLDAKLQTFAWRHCLSVTAFTFIRKREWVADASISRKLLNSAHGVLLPLPRFVNRFDYTRLRYAYLPLSPCHDVLKSHRSLEVDADKYLSVFTISNSLSFMDTASFAMLWAQSQSTLLPPTPKVCFIPKLLLLLASFKAPPALRNEPIPIGAWFRAMSGYGKWHVGRDDDEILMIIGHVESSFYPIFIIIAHASGFQSLLCWRKEDKII